MRDSRGAQKDVFDYGIDKSAEYRRAIRQADRSLSDGFTAMTCSIRKH
jgi:hypothetical protein